MDFECLSLTLPREDRKTILLREGTVRSVERSSQLLVMEVPTDAIDGTALSDRAGIEADASVVIHTTGRTYKGYVEVVAESPTGRFYWCGVC